MGADAGAEERLAAATDDHSSSSTLAAWGEAEAKAHAFRAGTSTDGESEGARVTVMRFVPAKAEPRRRYSGTHPPHPA